MSTKTNIHSGWNTRNAYGLCGSLHALERFSRTHSTRLLVRSMRQQSDTLAFGLIAAAAAAAAAIGTVVVAANATV